MLPRSPPKKNKKIFHFLIDCDLGIAVLICFYYTILLNFEKYFQNIHLKEEIEVLRCNQEQLMTENERLREQLAADSSIPKPVTTELSKPVANDRITIKGPAVFNRHPLKKGKQNRISCLMLCYQILFQLLIIPSFTIWSFQTTMIWTGLTSMYHNVWKRLPMNYSVK